MSLYTFATGPLIEKNCYLRDGLQREWWHHEVTDQQQFELVQTAADEMTSRMYFLFVHWSTLESL